MQLLCIEHSTKFHDFIHSNVNRNIRPAFNIHEKEIKREDTVLDYIKNSTLYRCKEIKLPTLSRRKVISRLHCLYKKTTRDLDKSIYTIFIYINKCVVTTVSHALPRTRLHGVRTAITTHLNKTPLLSPPLPG